jgi:SNF2 family DNA or RNA helicase
MTDVFLAAIQKQLDPYQVEGVAFLLRRPAAGLVWDPGVGKTLALLLAFYLAKKKGVIDKLLVAAPLNPAYETWPAEVEKWKFPLSIGILHGSKKDRVLQEDHDIYVVNYDGLGWLSDRWPVIQKKRVRWWFCADESTKVKHTNTQRFKILRPLLEVFHRRTILTGTPSPNGLLDLFGQVYVLDLGERLGRYITHYKREYFYPAGFGGYDVVPQPDAEERIYKALDGMLYRVSDEVLKLKRMRVVPLYVRLPPAARELYKRFEVDFIAELKSGTVLTAVNAGVLSMKLRQVANGRVLDADDEVNEVHDAKIEVIVDLVEQLQGNPLLIGYGFTADAKRLAEALGTKRDGPAPRIGGGVSRKEVTRLMAEFNVGRLPVLICQWDAVAHGVNLQQACHHIALFGLTWNLETYIQFNRRVHRKGQKRQVFVHHVIARDTVDEVVHERLIKKAETQKKLLEAIKKRYL